MYAGVRVVVFHQCIYLSVITVRVLWRVTFLCLTMTQSVVLAVTLGAFTFLTTFPSAVVRNQAVEAESVVLYKGATLLCRLRLEIGAFNDEMLTETEGALCLVAVVLLLWLLRCTV